jgi:hypothetical protein
MCGKDGRATRQKDDNYTAETPGQAAFTELCPHNCESSVFYDTLDFKLKSIIRSSSNKHEIQFPVFSEQNRHTCTLLVRKKNKDDYEADSGGCHAESRTGQRA